MSDTDDTRTAVRAGLNAGQRLHAVFELRVVDGPDRGLCFEVTDDHPGRLLIGKSQACDLRLTDPAVSRRHASVEIVDGHLRLQDLSSTNGTFVGDLVAESVRLRGGERLRLGYSTLEVKAGELRPGPELASVDRFGLTLGGSAVMRRLYPLCERLAQTDIAVVIEGETGTGKEQLAESLHLRSPRSGGPFVVFDCTAVSANLIESELFGHAKGAFTGSVRRHRGVFERADGGTLLIDEIGDLPLELQPKLLRAIERQSITPIGDPHSITVNVRVLSATRRDLDREVQLGRFRDDLFHRIAVARIELPPLRERKGDVALLARHFWEQLGGRPEAFPALALRKWNDDAWPGNVRELRNAITRHHALGDLDAAIPDAVLDPPSSTGHDPTSGDWLTALLARDLTYADARQRVMQVFERKFVDRLMDAYQDDTSRAAVAAGIGRRHFQRLIARARGQRD